MFSRILHNVISCKYDAVFACSFGKNSYKKYDVSGKKKIGRYK